MKKELEDYLWNNIRHSDDLKTRVGLNDESKLPRNVIHKMRELGMINNAKQAWRTLEKWCDQGKYEYGSRWI